MRLEVVGNRRSVLPRGVHGAADPHFAGVVRSFAAMFPARRFGGGALAVYLDGKRVVDVWTGWSDRRGRTPWTADTAPMVFSATKGMASTVIHRLVDRGLIDYDAPVAEYWPEFGANGKAGITVRQVLRHRAGLSALNGANQQDLLDHELMEQRIAAASPGVLLGKPAYHALTYGWLMSGLARAVTGKGMRVLFREELAEPLGTDGLHLGRPPAEAPTRPAQIIMPQSTIPNPLFDAVAPKIAALQLSGGFGAMYFPGAKAAVRGDIPLLDGELPAVNGVVTARALAKMYGAIANGGVIDGARFLSRELVAGLTGRYSLRPDRNILVPLSFHLGYHSVPFGVVPGFGHAGLGGSVGWADPASGLAYAFVHNRLLSPFVLVDHVGLVSTGALLRRAAAQARKHGFERVTEFGARFPERGAVAG
ncbi:serine hydrolase domain-containing protein [Mycobacterium shimoidei]|uniref:Putative esterase LipL [Mycobacterium tuberculosis H37Rv] n=1 Tax=Mycobacterium shimoidei TaxID=29313 RepID=A0A1E3TF01_MYCSH|nr:serine hydrolase domain-containing protein [Mycobacterium shimoidei]MCV7258292.1 beta-lactamase family protein [Mycobacterium shimoidei]ODR12972.1 esterase [Mycobacterium shimoidei]ORW82119.1 esterase [Mycobacterium shimoidei]SRX95468.1 putative esterase LipL [Mycobacterium tuberculosis H37Rv] [Mycobacterium shimoidei]